LEQVRAFIAVDLPGGVREALGRTLQDLRALVPEDVRWVRPEGIHLTLKFLGNIESESIGAISRAMSRCAASAAPFELSLGDLGAFPNLKTPRAIWLGPNRTPDGIQDGLLDLQRGLEDELDVLGYARERRSFSPHLTLGRIRATMSSSQRRRVGASLAGAPMNIRMEMPVGEIALIQSTLTPSGAIYTHLFSVSLGRAS
jgi:2'-5' RNA ligase